MGKCEVGKEMILQNKLWTPDNSFLLEYRARIECGEILVGQDLWLELENLKEDFHNDEYEYVKTDPLVCFYGKLRSPYKITFL